MNREQWLKKREHTETKTLLTALATGNFAALDRPRGMTAGSGQPSAGYGDGASATGWTTIGKPMSLPRSRIA